RESSARRDEKEGHAMATLISEVTNRNSKFAMNERSTAMIRTITIRILTLAAIALVVALVCGGCGSPSSAHETRSPASSGTKAPANVPTFSLAWSEYPSWSTFGVAHETGMIDGKKGSMGPIERKWNVDIELKEADYDPCITMYGAGQCDAVCITNM